MIRDSLYLIARGAPPPRAKDLGLERRLSASGEGVLAPFIRRQPP